MKTKQPNLSYKRSNKITRLKNLLYKKPTFKLVAFILEIKVLSDVLFYLIGVNLL